MPRPRLHVALLLARAHPVVLGRQLLHRITIQGNYVPGPLGAPASRARHPPRSRRTAPPPRRTATATTASASSAPSPSASPAPPSTTSSPPTSASSSSPPSSRLLGRHHVRRELGIRVRVEEIVAVGLLQDTVVQTAFQRRVHLGRGEGRNSGIRIQSIPYLSLSRIDISFLDPAIRKLDRSNLEKYSFASTKFFSSYRTYFFFFLNGEKLIFGIRIVFEICFFFFLKRKKDTKKRSYLSVHGRLVNVALRHDIIHDLFRRGPVSLPQIPDGVNHPGRHLRCLLPHFSIASPAFFSFFFQRNFRHDPFESVNRESFQLPTR